MFLEQHFTSSQHRFWFQASGLALQDRNDWTASSFSRLLGVDNLKMIAEVQAVLHPEPTER